ncbi:MAG: Unknown protein [uncultured Sulfurovum sp.]|uniref:Uncharacterized protein n=1 Tax=uncultured Sulfurovum sp. TaxID=269237 RepID=A0A6S6S3A5_9BACT|nr:MAG: Unknown protein [uncultured Sulfurovum sp.]
MGMNYQVTFLKGFTFEFKPSLLYTIAELTDKHILRGFYTVQNVSSFGYDVVLEGNYKLTNDSNIKLSLSHKSFADDHVSMDYYNALNEKYLSLSSSYHYQSATIGMGYSVSF